MNISEKIEDVRRQPEHIRLRYVWGCVAITMLFIIAIWIFSISSLFQGDKNTTNQASDSTTANITEQLQNLKQQAPSLKNFSEESLSLQNEGVAKTTVSTAVQNPTATTNTELPQADAYSNLPVTQ